MKKSLVGVLAVLFMTACSSDTAGPTDSLPGFDETADLSFSGSFVGDPRGNFLGPLHRLPENLKLSSEQAAQIRGLIDAFMQAVKADHEALAAIAREARGAVEAGKTRDEVRAILERGQAARERILQAEKRLEQSIYAVLTTEQKAWLDSHRPQACAAPLSDEQRTQISALVAAFEQANRADLAAIRTATEQANAALRNGASRETILAILESVRPAVMRVRVAEQALRAAINAVLTPDQRPCHRLPGSR